MELQIVYAYGYRYYNSLNNIVEDSGAEVERRPLVTKLSGSNPVMSGFCLWDFPTQWARVLAKYPGSRNRA